MISKQENYPPIAQVSWADRTLVAGRGDSNRILEEPAETIRGYRGLRSELERETKGLVLASYIPLLFIADVATEGDEGGTIVLIVCCLIAFYLFGVTGWQNEEIKK